MKQYIGRVKNRLIKISGLNDLHFHDLRHEAISRFIKKGLTIPEAASINGHKAQSMLLRYAHPDLSYIRRRRLGTIFWNLIPPGIDEIDHFQKRVKEVLLLLLF